MHIKEESKMKLEKGINNTIRQLVASEHERALTKLIEGKTVNFVIPIHKAKMKIYNKETQTSEIKETIIPRINIYLDDNAVVQDKINRNSMEYRIAYNNASFPLAHVYGSSGFLCLGNIFVPQLIEKYNPMQPLETLFLYNDRYLAHGHPKLPLDNIQLTWISKYLKQNNLSIPSFNKNGEEWLKNDVLWNMGHEMLKECSDEDAYQHMENIFKVIFKN